jgi:hypothetical protein
MNAKTTKEMHINISDDLKKQFHVNTARLRNFLVEASRGTRGRNGGRGRVLPPVLPLLI